MCKINCSGGCRDCDPQSYIDALQAQLTHANKVIEKCQASLIDSRDDVAEVLHTRNALAGYPRYDTEIRQIEKQLTLHDETLTTITKYREGK